MTASATIRHTVMRSQLGRARGLGSARSGTSHWLAERASAAALLPLSTWFVVQMFRLGGAPHKEVTAWGAKPVNAAMLLGLVISSFYHAESGMQVIVDDYVHGRAHAPVKLAVKVGLWLIGLLGVVSVLKIALGQTSSRS